MRYDMTLQQHSSPIGRTVLGEVPLLKRARGDFAGYIISCELGKFQNSLAYKGLVSSNLQLPRPTRTPWRISKFFRLNVEK